VLAAAIERVEGADLVLAATESSDGYTGTVPEQIAAILDLPSITFAKSVEIAGGTVKVQRQTEAGYDEVESPLPAVVSVTAGVVEPRYPSFKGIMAAKSKPVDRSRSPTWASTPHRRLGRRRPGDRRGRRQAEAREAGEVIEDDGEAFEQDRRLPRRAQGHLSPPEKGTQNMTLSKIWVFAETCRGHRGSEHHRSSCWPRPVRSPTPSRSSPAPTVRHRRRPSAPTAPPRCSPPAT
jgi:hypothetical protein